MHQWTRNFLVNFLAACVLVLSVADAFAADRVVLGNAFETPLSTSTDEHTASTLKELRSKTAKGETVRVIVGVRAAFAPEGKVSAAAVTQQRNEIAHMHDAVLRNNPSLKARPGKARTFRTIPFMALEVDANELEALAGQSEITSIEEDRLVMPTLADSVPLIGGTAAWSSGYTGAGQAIAIVDTGVDSTHPFLAGKVVSEACYSTTSVTYGTTSLCPGGVAQSTAAGSGANCDPTISGCHHGTHVAGIAAGKGASFSGVAKDASLIAIKVFSRVDNASICGSTAPCVRAFSSDYNLALEQVYLLRDTYSIAAVNMSLGGVGYSDQNSCDGGNSSTKTAIDNLRSVNIATVISSGNDGYTDKISAPGCISSAVSVGATTKTDEVASYSNSASFLNLLAPGSDINSSVPGGAYSIKSGTSMAAPHAAGSWALLKQQNPIVTVTEALNLLSLTGNQITDTRNGINTPRIRVDGALNIALNAAPTLTYSQETGYGSVGVNPTSGTAATMFSYKVIYADIANIAPTSIRVCIDGICNAMSKDAGASPASHDGSYTNGEQYVYTTPLAVGAHSYYFAASRGATTITLPASGTLSGPGVSDLAIGTTTLPDGDIGIAYSSTLAASGGTPPYSWSAPGLPPGLNINSATGVISGTPTHAGIYAFMATVSDSASASFSKALSIDILDYVAPTVPTGLTARRVGATQVSLYWTASTDNVGVTGYKVYRNGVQIGTATGILFIDTGVAAEAAYSYTVAACDAAGNCSAQSTAVSATALVAGTVVAWGNDYWGQVTVPAGLYGVVVAVAGGAYHTMALKSDGTVVAWGYNNRGQATVPAGLSGVTAIAAGTYDNLALKNDGTVVGWPTEAPAGLSGVVAISAGTFSNVALKNDGTVVAWGIEGIDSPVVPAGLSGVVGIAAGGGYTVALKNDGTVVAWGSNSAGQTTVPAGLSGVVKIATGAESGHVLALKSDGTVVAWGYDYWGQATVPAGLSGVVDIAAGYGHSVALKNDGTVVAWGSNDYGVTTVPAGLSGVTAIAAGSSHSLALTTTLDDVAPTVPTSLIANASSSTQVNLSWMASTDNVGMVGYKVYRNGVQVGTSARAFFIDTGLTAATAYSYTVAACDAAANCSAQSTAVSAVSATALVAAKVVAWGNNSGGQTTVPAGLNGVIAIAGGGYHTVALKNDGTVVAWGSNSYGQTTVPAGLSGVVAVAANGSNTAALKNDGTMVAWGDNISGQTTVPAGLNGVIAIAVGGSHTVALKNNGTVVEWGSNGFGQTTIPPGLNGVVAVAAGISHTVALKNDGTVVAWGLDNNGQSTVPADLNGVIAVAAGGYHTVALKNDGTVVAWGNNTYGQTMVPAGLSGVVEVTGGYSHTVALKNDGTVVAWGRNTDGQLTMPAGLSRVTTIAAGGYHTVALVDIDTASPAVPTGLTATAVSAAQINLSWTASADNFGVTGYKVYRDGVQVGTSVGTNFTDTGLTSATPYSYTVAACDAAGNCSAQSTAATATTLDNVAPTVPTGLVANAINGEQINLSWTASTDNYVVTGYQVFRNGVQVGTPTGTSFSDAGLTGLTTYSYALAACDAAGNCSEQSAAVSATTLADTTPPVVTPSQAGGKYTFTLSITLIASEPATVYYTLDGTTPTTASTVYASAIAVNSSLTFKYFAIDMFGNASTVQTQSYMINLPPPGTVVAWGDDSWGQATVPAGLNGVVVAVAGGAYHTLALKNDGTVVAWGDNNYGVTTVPAGLSGVTAIAAGTYDNLALKNDGTVVGWPTEVPAGLSGVVAISAGTLNNVALKNDGTVVAWGIISPGVPAGLSGVVGIAAGAGYNVALKNDGTVVAWGDSSAGQTAVPAGLSGVVKIATGANNGHVLALKNDGTVVAWGDDSWGQATVPAGLSGVVDIAAGYAHSMALKSDGTVVAWGSNDYGETTVPAGLSGVKTIAAGSSHSLALTTLDSVAPTVPTGLTASAVSAKQINLSWVASTDSIGVTGYKVYRNDDQVGTPTGTTFTDTGLKSVTTYRYKVAACDAAGNCSAKSTSATATTLENMPPTVPSGLTAKAASATQINLTWKASTDNVGVTGYIVYRNGVQVGTSTGTSFSDTGLVTVTTYKYTVAACDAARNCSKQSATVTATTMDNVAPTVPGSLTAKAASATQINLSWTTSTDNVGVKGYKVYRNGVQVGTPTGTTFSDASLKSATTYSYTVAACDAAGNCSAQSAAATATTLDNVAPTLPTLLAANAVSRTQINLTWQVSTDNVGVTGYRVYRNGVRVGTPSGISFSDTGLTAATAYRYTVAACDAAGNCSAQSSAVTASTLR